MAASDFVLKPLRRDMTHCSLTLVDGRILIMAPNGSGHSSILELREFEAPVDMDAIAELICRHLDGASPPAPSRATWDPNTGDTP